MHNTRIGVVMGTVFGGASVETLNLFVHGHIIFGLVGTGVSVIAYKLLPGKTKALTR